ncbi:hypothetical protein NP233_g734 [Leucocoprinus birnbaumii]|uniref:Uncharacterized protein n=1 Tax=Leucocoprinus birnbaumii TaxID=56174 RepID=A0AAD5YYG5_9AGAR|nr:hypothetical protein NP233_g734 [Leucocoprinus birnbaumii]
MTIPSRRGALHILALIATDDTERTKISNCYEDQPHHTAADVRIPLLCNADSPVMHNVSNLHLTTKPVSCPTDPNTTQKPLSSHSAAEESISTASNSSSSSSSSSSHASSLSSATSSRRTRSSGKNDRDRKTRSASSQQSGLELNKKLELRAKRSQKIEKAKKISSLDNSPANDRQLHVLRMVYDEITMYPSEPWIAILAIIIHRSAHMHISLITAIADTDYSVSPPQIIQASQELVFERAAKARHRRRDHCHLICRG